MSTKCCKIQKEFREMESVYGSLCTTFGENATDLDSQEFFKLIHNFAESYSVRIKTLCGNILVMADERLKIFVFFNVDKFLLYRNLINS